MQSEIDKVQQYVRTLPNKKKPSETASGAGNNVTLGASISRRKRISITSIVDINKMS